MKHRYIYNGPVMEFDRIVAMKWSGETIAESEKKAKSNLGHQFKTQNNRQSNVRITLPGKLTEMETVM